MVNVKKAKISVSPLTARMLPEKLDCSCGVCNEISFASYAKENALLVQAILEGRSSQTIEQLSAQFEISPESARETMKIVAMYKQKQKKEGRESV